MAEQIEHGKTGYLFDNAKQAMEQLCSLIENKDKIAEIGENARQHAREHFLDAAVIAKMLEFMK